MKSIRAPCFDDIGKLLIYICLACNFTCKLKLIKNLNLSYYSLSFYNRKIKIYLGAKFRRSYSIFYSRKCIFKFRERYK